MMTPTHYAIYNEINTSEALWRQMVHYAQNFEKDFGAGLMLKWLHERGITHTKTGYKYSKTAIRNTMRGW